MRERRVTTACNVEFMLRGAKISAVSEDLSRYGIFVRTNEALPVGERVHVTLYSPSGNPIPVAARVASVLTVAAAKAIGRTAGIGFELLDRRTEIHELLDELIEELTPPPPREPSRSARVLVVDSHQAMRKRLQSALEAAGMFVEVAVSAAEALVVCSLSPPTVVVVADKMPTIDGWTMVQRLAGNLRSAQLPVVMISDDPSDMTRLNAYRLGVAEFILKPFTDDELVIRVGRCAHTSSASPSDLTALRGQLGAMSLATLLSLLDFERKSGILLVVSDGNVGRLFVAQGRVVKIDASAAGHAPHDKLLAVLDWKKGTFEFLACEVEGVDEVGVATQHLLLEHARRSDEAAG